MDREALKAFLDRKAAEYNQPSFIESDPIAVPHRFTKIQDIEIAGFFAAVFAWGNRTTIIRKSLELMNLMDNSPHAFIVSHPEIARKRFEGFCHRTFNSTDLLYFISFLQYHYQQHDSLQAAFIPPEDLPGRLRGAQKTPDNHDELGVQGAKHNDELAVQEAKYIHDEPVERILNHFHGYFFSLPDVPERTKKHVAAPFKNSACKRLNMFLRWMVRKDPNGVDFGIWNLVQPAYLICPLDVHVARVARSFGLTDRPQADWQTAIQLTQQLRTFDPKDPVKYDYALFALGIVEKF